MLLYNKIWDKYSKISGSDTDINPLNLLSHNDFKKSTKNNIRKKWQKLRKSQTTKLNQIKSTIFKWENPNLNRKDETTINRLSIGYIRITHRFLVSNDEPPICEDCNTKITVKHIITECHVYQQKRTNLILTEMKHMMKFLDQTPIKTQKSPLPS